MKPERLAAAQLREGVQRVDRSGVDRPGGADDDRGGKARRPVLRDRALEEIQADPESLVGLDLAQVPGADPEQVDGLVDAVVDLVGRVDDQLRTALSAEPVLADVAGRHRATRRGESGEVRHRAARDEDSLCARRETQQRREPANDLVFDVDRGVVAPPAIRIERGRQVVRGRPDRIGGRVDEPEKAGVRVSERVRKHVLADDEVPPEHDLAEQVVPEPGNDLQFRRSEPSHAPWHTPVPAHVGREPTGFPLDGTQVPTLPGNPAAPPPGPRAGRRSRTGSPPPSIARRGCRIRSTRR